MAVKSCFFLTAAAPSKSRLSSPQPEKLDHAVRGIAGPNQKLDHKMPESVFVIFVHLMTSALAGPPFRAAPRRHLG
jgi:hypothetical protein